MHQGMPRVQQKVLPRELIERGSDLNQMVSLAGDLVSHRHGSAQALVNKTRTLLHQACPHYKPSRKDPVICRSGEDNGRAYRGRVCSQCTVAQFSPNMVFIGELTKGSVVESVATH